MEAEIGKNGDSGELGANIRRDSARRSPSGLKRKSDKTTREFEC